MKCRQALERLDDLLDSDLTIAERFAVESHVAECSTCRAELEARRSIQERARDLATDRVPRRDLWPGIAARIEDAPSSSSAWWLQLAAAAIALAVLSIPLTVWWSSGDGESGPAADRIAVVTPASVAQAELARTEDGVQLARTDLVTALERHRDIIADETLREWVESVAVLDQAIGELRSALAEDPRNRRLRMLLASRYQQERRLLQKFSRV
jgi:anti-sigma factor RsiW